MKKANSQLGFSIVEGILILVILGMIGSVGWYVWQSKQNADASLNSAVKTQLKTPKSAAISTRDWQTYDGEGYSFKYPKDWKVTKLAENVCPGGAEDYKADTCPIQFAVSPTGLNEDEVLKNSFIRGMLITNARATLNEVYDLYKMQYEKVLKAEKMKINNLDSILVQQEASSYIRSYYVTQLSTSSYLDFIFDHKMDSTDNTQYEDIALGVINSVNSD